MQLFYENYTKSACLQNPGHFFYTIIFIVIDTSIDFTNLL